MLNYAPQYEIIVKNDFASTVLVGGYLIVSLNNAGNQETIGIYRINLDCLPAYFTVLSFRNKQKSKVYTKLPEHHYYQFDLVSNIQIIIIT